MSDPVQGAIILSPPRAGSTLLRRLLDGHPKISAPGETNLFTACGRFLRQECIAEDVPVGVLSGMELAGVARQQTLDGLWDVANNLMATVCHSQQTTTWISKTPDDVFYIDEIEKLCGDRCRFLCLFRHGADVAVSVNDLCQKNEVYLAEIHNYIRRFPAPLEALAQMWVDTTSRMLQFLQDHSQNAMRIDYESLVANPEQVMHEAFEFLGYDTVDWSIAEALGSQQNLGLGDWKTYQRSAIDSSSIGRWQQLSRSTQSRLGRILNPTLEDTGYVPLRITPSRTEQDAQRRYQLGLMVQAANVNSTAPIAPTS